MKEYYTMEEISDIYHINSELLNDLEKIGIIKRHKDYRNVLYSISNMWNLNLAKELKDLGFSIEMIEEYLEDRNLNSTNKLLKNGITLLDDQILKLLKQKENMRKRMESIKKISNNSNLNNIELKYLKKRYGFILDEKVKRYDNFNCFAEKFKHNQESNFDILSNKIGSILNVESLRNGITNEFNSIFYLTKDDTENYNLTLQEGYYVTLTYSGDYINNEVHINHMFDFINENKLIVMGNAIELYRVNIYETENKNEFITEIQIPVKC